MVEVVDVGTQWLPKQEAEGNTSVAINIYILLPFLSSTHFCFLYSQRYKDTLNGYGNYEGAEFIMRLPFCCIDFEAYKYRLYVFKRTLDTRTYPSESEMSR